jgi:Flp pilus assembly protein TadG
MSPFSSNFLRRFRRDEQGNVSMIFAFSVPVLALAMGVGVDFTNAAVTRSRLTSAADAAVLAALTPATMKLTDDQAKTAAYAMFDGRAQTISSVTQSSISRTITITHPATNTGMRVVTLNYSASVNALFGGVLAMFGALPANTGMSVGGTSTAQAAGPPNINFYLLLDNSPSMSLPATTAGVTQMIALTPTQDGGNGCAFACHQASTNNSDTQGNLCSDGSKPTVAAGSTPKQYCAAKNAANQPITQIDDYAMARKNNITLRLDELTNGVTTLMQTAYSFQTTINPSNPPVYQFAAYSMDTLWSIGTTNNQLMNLSASYQSAWTTASQNFGVMQMYANDVTCGNSACSSAGSQNDVATNYDVAMSSMNTIMPTPGNGTNTSSAQELLFFVTDGVEDENNGGSRLIQAINANGATNWCNTIKARGIKIAVLYTSYLPVTTNWFYNTKVGPWQSNIGPALQACASSGLYYEAAVGADLGKALSTLFNTAMQQNAALLN